MTSPTHDAPPTSARTPRRATLLVLVGIVLLSVNLRPAAVSVGPVLSDVRDSLEMNGAVAGVLTSLPVLAFACFGALAPALARIVGVHRVTLLALGGVVAGLAGRAVVPSAWEFLVLTAVALAGMAVANVLMPSLVKLHFPDRIGLVTSIYTTALAIGLTSALLLTVPLSHALGGWRPGLGAWAALAAVAAVPWLALVAHDRHLDAAPRTVRASAVARTSVGRQMALLFGLQSLQAYVVFGWFATVWRDSGYSPAAAGALAGLLAGVSIPLSFVLPSMAARRDDQRSMLFALTACYPVAYVGMMVAPHALAVVWAVVVGVGTCVFPIVLTLIGLRARTPEGTAALSGFTQSVGYLIAGLGPFGFGWLHDLTGGWTVPLVVLLALSLPMFVLAQSLGRPAYVEDQLGANQ